MKNTWKRIIALILAMAMCLSLLSANVWAAEEPADGSSSPQDSQIETLAEESSEEDAAEQEDSVEEPQEERSAEEEDSTSEPDAAADAPDDSEESDPVQQDDTKEEQENVVPEETIKEEADSAEEETPALPEPDIDSSEDSTEGEPDQNEENAEQPEAEDSLAQAFDENDVLDGGDAALTRGEWMHNLAVMFELKVDEDGAPDDYFSDLDSSYQYYSDVLACVTYGVIDVEEGEAIGVNNTLTRDYAAHTLNYLIGYQLDSGSYTFSDSSDCSDADSAQIAVNQGWMNLVNGRFMPNQPVTTDEISRMVSDARSARDNDTISSEHENTFEFAPDVIVVPDGTEVSIDDSNTITIQNCPVSIKKNDRFAVYLNGIAVVYSATSVELSETKTIITTKEVDDTEVYTACNAEGVIEPDITLIQPADGVKLTFVDESTDTTYLSAQSALEAMGSHVLKKASITTEYKYKVNDSISVKVKAKLKDPKIEYSIMDGNTVASAKMTSDIEVSFSVEGDLAALNKPVGTDKIYLFQWGVPGIGGFDVFVDVELSGKVSGVKKGKLTTGFTCDNNNNFRVIYQYQPSGLSINAEATAGLGIQAQLGLTQMPLVKAYVYGKAGAKAQLSEKNYTDSNLPHVCSEFKAYLYASYGAKGQISTLNKKNSFSVNIEKTVLNEKNSPIRILKHYEDGKLVNSCSRGNAIGYLTSGNSKYAGSGWSLGSGFGFDEAGNSVNVYDYILDDDGNAVITKFNGSSAVVSIPDTIDGYKVVKIGNKAFQKNTRLRVVIVPDGVGSIGGSVFANCINLSSVDLPDSVTEIGNYAFANTALTSLTLPRNLTTIGARILSETTGVKEITIPKSVTETRYNIAGYVGSFDNSYLEKVVFEEGITKVPTQVCDECKYLKEAIIPNSVTEIGNYAFAGTALTSLTLPKNLTTMGARILSGTTGVKEITIPKSVTETRYNIAGYVGSFDNSCLEEVVFEEGITKVPSQACEGCEYLKEVVIPNSVTEIGGYAFERCKSLNRITLPDTITEIGNRAFANAGLVSPVLPQNLLKINEGVFQNCTSLTSIVLPNSSTSLGTYLFDGCTGLKNVTINNTQQTITSCMFHNCIALEEITLPDTVTTIQDHAFKGCTALKTIHWSKSLNQINSYAFENCEALEEIEVPATVTSVGEGAFYNCDGLKKATIPDSVSSFGKKMFYDCDVLTTVSLGTGLTTLPESAFEHCDVLESLVVPFRVATIGKNLLKDSVKFKEITIPRATTSIDASAFSYPGKLTIYGVGGTYAETFANANNITFVDKQVNATKVELSQTQITMNKGATQKLVMTVMPNNFTDLVTWKSTKPEIATIADDGTVKAVGIGETTIKLTVGSVSATCKVTVVQPVTSISLNRNSVSLEALSTFQLTATAYPDNANNREVEWSSSEPDTASVNSTGLVTAHKKGTATITALAKDGSGVKRTCTVTVTNTAHIAATVEELESEHNYPDKCSDFWVYSLEGANALDVTFDTRTDIEEDFDFLYLYDGEGNEVGTYTGTSLAGQTVTVPGSIVRIKLVSDNSGNTWGFKVSSVTKSENQQPGHTHTWDEGSVTTPATCKNKGVKTYNCTGCDETKTEDIDKNPDNHVGGTEIRGRKAATCGTAGYTGDTYCLGCGVKVASGSVISATGKHNWDKGMVTKEPTTAEEGERTYTCGVCGGTKTEVIEKLPEPEKEENVISGKDTFTKTVNVKKNQTFMLGASANGAALSYKSNNKKVTVAKNGKVTIKKGFVGTAIITITAAETDEYLSTSKDVTVFVNPSVTQLSSVKWDKKKKTANVAWKKNTTGKGYEVQYATDKKFNKSLKTINIKKNKTVKTVVKKLAKGTYYFRIRTVNGNNYSAWSKVKTLKIAK